MIRRVGLMAALTLCACATAPQPAPQPAPPVVSVPPVVETPDRPLAQGSLDLSSPEALRRSFLEATAGLPERHRLQAANGLIMLGYNGAVVSHPDLPPHPVSSPGSSLFLPGNAEGPISPYGPWTRIYDNGADRLTGMTVQNLIEEWRRISGESA